MAVLDGLYAPQWAGAWTWTRVFWALAALRSWVPRWRGVGDAYGSDDAVFSIPPVRLADTLHLSESTAWGLWGLTVGLAVGVGAGGRWTKLALLGWIVAAWLLLLDEAMNIKAHDRLELWIALALLLGPTGETRLAAKRRSPAARWFLLLVYCALYGSTGWLKLMEEPGWRTGETLAYHLLNVDFAGGPLAVWLSGQRWLVAPLSWWAVGFETLFPFLIWFRRTNPWLLVAGALMHTGISAVMDVGAFWFVALSGYPVLLHPEWGERLAARLPRWAGGLRG